MASTKHLIGITATLAAVGMGAGFQVAASAHEGPLISLPSVSAAPTASNNTPQPTSTGIPTTAPAAETPQQTQEQVQQQAPQQEVIVEVPVAAPAEPAPAPAPVVAPPATVTGAS